jgi:alpha-glucosidase (family GH31 glycosyl hydrolase)
MEEYFKILHHPLEDEGVDFWWIDWQQGPHSEVKGVDPLWVLNHYHYLDSGRKGERRFTFSRYAGPGSHRYPIGFSGVSHFGRPPSGCELIRQDTVISWESLDFQPEFTATASNIGYGWWSHDIGGHYHGVKDDELMARWTQLGVFSPILRLHSSESPFNTREPWSFSGQCQSIVTKNLQYRHRLVPYLYSGAVRAASDHKNVVEPLYYDFPETPEAYMFKNQFFFGSELMVVPITAPADKATTLAQAKGWLPPGRWVDIFSGTVYDGDRVLSFHRTMEEYPVFAKEGAIIPLDGRDGSAIDNGCGIPHSIEIILVVGANGSFDLMEDDGTGAGIEDVTFTTTPIRYDQTAGTLTIGPSENPLLNERTWSVRLVSYYPVGDVSLQVDSLVVIPAPVTELGVLPLGKFSTSSTITLTLPHAPQLYSVDHMPHIFKLLGAAQIGIDLKGTVWNALKGASDGEKASKIRALSRLNATEASGAMKSAIEELLLADLRC